MRYHCSRNDNHDTMTGKEIPELKFLLAEVGRIYGRGIHTTTDFEALSVVIEHSINERISASTLKRMWGYVTNRSAPRLATLDILSRYVGKPDFRQFCETLKKSGLTESGLFSSVRISASDLAPGAVIRLGWNPDRLILLEYLGASRFRVRENLNSSLRAGDEFEASAFFLGYPLYIPAILRDGADLPAYIAGSINGLTTLELL